MCVWIPVKDMLVKGKCYFSYTASKKLKNCKVLKSELENVLQLKILITFGTVFFLLWVYATQIQAAAYEDRGTKMFIVTIFIVAKKWNQVTAIKRVIYEWSMFCVVLLTETKKEMKKCLYMPFL